MTNERMNILIKNATTDFVEGVTREQLAEARDLWVLALKRLDLSPNALFKVLGFGSMMFPNHRPDLPIAEKLNILRAFAGPHGVALFKAYKIQKRGRKKTHD